MPDTETQSNQPLTQVNPDVQQIYVPLTFDTEFFGLLQDDVFSLDAIQKVEQRAMTDEIKALGDEITKLAIPTKSNKTDIGRWRKIFDIYLQAGVFFSTNELDHGSRDSNVALKQLQWFQQQVTKLDLPGSFKLPKSRDALDRFTQINITLLRNLKFQEINQLAIRKILKSRYYQYHFATFILIPS
jgi:E3 ubiquitin-protein ligase BAH